jgi:hypothetical protein
MRLGHLFLAPYLSAWLIASPPAFAEIEFTGDAIPEVRAYEDSRPQAVIACQA